MSLGMITFWLAKETVDRSKQTIDVVKILFFIRRRLFIVHAKENQKMKMPVSVINS